MKRQLPLLYTVCPGFYHSDLYKYFILLATFLAYLSFHASRKPITIVKAQLHHNCSSDHHEHPNTNDTTWCDWKPFDKDNYKQLFSILDSGFLVAYAISMFFSGFIAERSNLRIFLFFGMFASGVFTILFGIGYSLNIHVFTYYFLIQTINGIVQSSGWPGVVTLVANWFGEGRRGLIMGIWNSHTSLGNITGSLLAAAFVTSDWMLSFVLPGVLIITVGFLVLISVATHPKDLNLTDDQENEGLLNQEEPIEETTSLGSSHESSTRISSNHEAISFCKALMIPGVIPFSFCLFFSKLVNYTFLFWLPYYLASAFNLDAKESGDYSTIFDVGGILGGITAGAFSDSTGSHSVVCAVMLVFGCIMLFIFQSTAAISAGFMSFMLFITGLFVNGPYALITTAVSADLGSNNALQGNSAALATVTAIIDGCGSLGAALGPYLVGFIDISKSWDGVFIMLLVCNIMALTCLSGCILKDLRRICR